MKRAKLTAEKRKLFGRKVKTLRESGRVPANVYGRKIDSLAVSVRLNDFRDVYEEVGETGLLELTIDGDVRTVLIGDVQVHPVSEEIIHVDFKQVDLKEKVTAQVPVEVVGESLVEKQGAGTLIHDLPEKFEVDATSLTEVNQAVVVGDLKVKRGVEIKAQKDEIVVKVEELRREEEPEQVVAEGEEEETPEGEEAAEGKQKGEAGAMEDEKQTEQKEESSEA